MKDFNVEDLPRKNIYKTTDNFEEMQDNILQRTVFSIAPVPEISVKKNKNWLYGAAASVALMVGMTVYLNDSDVKPEKKQEVLVSNNDTDRAQNRHLIKTVLPGNTALVQPSATSTALEAPEIRNLKSVPVPVEDRIIKDPPYYSSKETFQNDFEQVTNNLAENELADLNSDSDGDVYLDLYN